MPFRFIHTADIHLDSPLRSLALRDPELARLVGDASRRAFTHIIDLCLDEAVDALLIAGDLHDGGQTSMKTALFLAAQLRRLHEAAIPTFIIRGNHDALSRVIRELTLPETVRLFGGRAEAVALNRAPGDLPVIIHGLSFAQPRAPEGLLARYRAPEQGAINIGMMHTSLDGAPGHDLYAPCATADLLASGFDYWALGHIHRRSVAHGGCTVVMPGIPQGRDIGEAGVKSVSLVTIDNDRTVHVEPRPTGVAQFERTAIDLSGLDDWRAMLHAVAAALGALRETVAAEHLIVRIALTGATPLAWRLHRDSDQLLGEFSNVAAGLPACWIDGVDASRITAPADADQPDADQSDADQSGGSAVAELRRLIAADILPAEAYQSALAEIACEVCRQLPPDCRPLPDGDAAEARGALTALAEDGVRTVLARLQAAPDDEVS